MFKCKYEINKYVISICGYILQMFLSTHAVFDSTLQPILTDKVYTDNLSVCCSKILLHRRASTSPPRRIFWLLSVFVQPVLAHKTVATHDASHKTFEIK